jgi:hypothetical protein
MSSDQRSDETTSSSPWWKTEPVIGVLMLIILLCIAVLSIQQLNPPTALDSNAPLNEFSASRAMKHLASIARTPHPIGAVEHEDVRRYLMQELSALGLVPEVQETTVVNPNWVSPYSAATVQNVVALLKGTENSQAILLVGHYDSVPAGPGAADNGAAVATMLETLRALKSSEPLKNDVILLFTDAEEFGLLGARAFVEQHRWAKNVGAVFNFDARGNSGPVIMFETSRQNGGLIREFARAARYPVATSFSYDIYRILPNNTDFTIFQKANLSGLNFANINGFINYHTQLDNVENVDARTVQHQGAYALALVRHFGNLRLPIPPERNAVYFNTIGSILIHYPSSWSIIWTLLTALLFVAVVIAGFRSGRLQISGIIRGFLMLLFTTITAGIAGTILWWLIRLIHTDERLSNQGNTYNSYLYMIGFVLLSVALTLMFYNWLLRRTNVESVATGALLWWVILMILTTLLLPGSSYLFTWPLLFSVIALGTVLIFKDHPSVLLKAFAVTAFAIPAILIFAPMIYLVFTALALWLAGIIMVLVALSIGVLLAQLQIIATPRKVLLARVALMSSLGFFVAGIISSGFGASHPQVNSLLYGLDADSGQAFWASGDRRRDEWTGQVISARAGRATLAEVFPLGTRQFLKEQAPPVAALNAPQVKVLSDSINGSLRTLRLHVTSSRQASQLSVYLEPDVEVLASTVNGQPLKSPSASTTTKGEKEWGLSYAGAPRDGIELTIDVNTTKPIKLKVVDRSDGLPETLVSSLKHRPDYLMPSIMPNNGTTLVSKSFVF